MEPPPPGSLRANIQEVLDSLINLPGKLNTLIKNSPFTAGSIPPLQERISALYERVNNLILSNELVDDPPGEEAAQKASEFLMSLTLHMRRIVVASDDCRSSKDRRVLSICRDEWEESVKATAREIKPCVGALRNFLVTAESLEEDEESPEPDTGDLSGGSRTADKPSGIGESGQRKTG